MSLTATEPQGEKPGTMTHRQALLSGGNVARAVMGGHKGYALAVVLEVLCGVLTGAGFGLAHAHERIGSAASPPDLGHLLMALDIKRLLPLAAFQERLAALIEQIHASERAEGVERVWLPGELEFTRREARRRDGIPVTEDALTTLQAVAQSLGLPLKI
jgi:LDH2 family malate/lactate/ureidoglycolate dehydrogenase